MKTLIFAKKDYDWKFHFVEEVDDFETRDDNGEYSEDNFEHGIIALQQDENGKFIDFYSGEEFDPEELEN